MIGVVIPTIPGREALYEQSAAGYRASEAVDVTVIRAYGYPSIGEAWQAGLRHAIREGCDVIHLGADDVIPHPRALLVGQAAANAGIVASPRVLNPDGTLHSCGTLGGGMLLGECESGTTVASSPFPTVTAGLAMAMSPIPPIHYYADDYIGWAARTYGFRVLVAREYEFRHLEGSVGRARVVARSGRDRDTFLAAVAARGVTATPQGEYDPGDVNKEAA